MTASYFDRDIVYEWDNMLYENWRTAGLLVIFTTDTLVDFTTPNISAA